MRQQLKKPGRAGFAAAVVMIMAAPPVSALFLTTYGDFARMSEAQQAQIVESAIYEMI